MSRSAQDVLEFDKLRELLRSRTTCAPGGRHIESLVFTQDGAALESAFALIREAREWLRTGDLGFGGLADPESWLEKLAAPGAVLEPGEFLDCATLLETAGWLGLQFREQQDKFPLLAARASHLADFRDALAAIRRSVLPSKEIADEASPTLRRIRASIVETRN